MIINIKIKQASKRRLILDKQQIEIAKLGESPSLQDLIIAVVRQQVNAYNAKTSDIGPTVIPWGSAMNFLSPSFIEDKATVGKVSFGSVYNSQKADFDKSIQIAIEAYIDGLYAVAIDNTIVQNLHDIIQIDESSTLTFIKLTLLR
jgi:hypothetical protein